MGPYPLAVWTAFDKPKTVAWANKTYGSMVSVVRLQKISHMFDGWEFVDWLDTDMRYEVRKARADGCHDIKVPLMLIVDAGRDHIAWADGWATSPV